MNIAVIIENRGIDDLDLIVDAHMMHLPEWHLDVIKDIPIKTLNDYNRLLTSETFWEKYQDYERVLIFQSDSMILRKGIEAFMEYDYYGAPWTFQQTGGNGGLSIRNPKKCLSLVKHRKWSINDGYEDVYFSNHLHEVGGVVAPREECEKFSCETIFKLGTFGVHAIQKYLTATQVGQIMSQYV